MPSKHWKRAHRARRRARRRGQRKPAYDYDYIQHYLLTKLLGPQLLPRPPVDPYARGNVVPPMKTAQKVSAERYTVANKLRGTGGKPLWGNRPYNPDFGGMSTGLVRTTVPLWSSAAEARRPEYRAV